MADEIHPDDVQHKIEFWGGYIRLETDYERIPGGGLKLGGHAVYYNRDGSYSHRTPTTWNLVMTFADPEPPPTLSERIAAAARYIATGVKP